MNSVITPKQPQGAGWKRATWWRCPPDLAALGYPIEPWEHVSGLFALSAVEVAIDKPGMKPLGPEYHLSVSMNGARCSSADALFALAAFDLSDAKEDNHVPNGRVRNFWRYVADKLSGYECSCVETEPAIREDKGDFVWRGVS
jgi:hypothetical protein